ncbi:MAG TPA: flagellar type III secretion system pore protein FliP, partial [Edaphobacter sp.]|nr:flagellar type III secretion system pore protein FliP [Edaphobacter sp.]
AGCAKEIGWRMFLARRMHWMVLAVAALASFPLAPSAQAAVQPGMIAFAAPVKSPWTAGTSKSGKHQGLTDTRDRAQPSPKGKDSIAQAIEANRSVPWSIVLGLTLLTLLPALLLSITPMVRLLVVFHFLRQALGTQTAPSNQILMGLALMMTWFLMQPVLVQVEQTAVAPYRAGTISGMEAMDRGLIPVKHYMLRYAREKDLAVFAVAGMDARPQSREDLPIRVVIPAYILSELKVGFQIGAILFLPFLLVDLVVASVTTSIGMMQLPPVVISTPLKILLFVMVDGWNLLAHQLIKSF